MRNWVNSQSAHGITQGSFTYDSNWSQRMGSSRKHQWTNAQRNRPRIRPNDRRVLYSDVDLWHYHSLWLSDCTQATPREYHCGTQ